MPTKTNCLQPLLALIAAASANAVRIARIVAELMEQFPGEPNR